MGVLNRPAFWRAVFVCQRENRLTVKHRIGTSFLNRDFGLLILPLRLGVRLKRVRVKTDSRKDAKARSKREAQADAVHVEHPIGILIVSQKLLNAMSIAGKSGSRC